MAYLDSLDDQLLERRSGRAEDEKRRWEWTDYVLDGKLIHRSYRVELKEPLTFSETGIGELITVSKEAT